MSYKVFLVEDEIVTREGIRDRIDWSALGYEFCGEAPDGEMALPLIEAARPDVVITDIKMPFMDGLQLSRILRERLPDTRVIILSGHDEFHYAQEAIQLGVAEYLLKPVSTQDIERVLNKTTLLLREDEERRRQFQGLKQQVEDNLPLLKERFFLRLVTGDLSAAEAVDQSRKLQIDLLAPLYQVVVVRVEAHCFGDPAGSASPNLPYQQLQSTDRLISAIVQNARDVLMFKKDIEETVLILKGEQRQRLEQNSFLLARMIQDEVGRQAQCQVSQGIGSVRERLGEISRSFFEALERSQRSEAATQPASVRKSTGSLAALDRKAVDHYLKTGLKSEFDPFFTRYIQPLEATSLEFRIFLNYVLIDFLLTAASFVNSLGGQVQQVIPEAGQIEQLLEQTKTLDQLRQLARNVFSAALDFRDRQAGRSASLALQKARDYIAAHYADPELSLQRVAMQANLSPSHFSQVFSRETGENFIDYLIRVRMEKAMELLRTSDLKSYAIAERVGYTDPHYFSAVFKKHTGLTPTEYRQQARPT